MPSTFMPDAINEISQHTSSLPRSTFTLDLDFWVLCSLYFQFALIALGTVRRKMIRIKFLPLFTAVNYLYAITVANYAMGVVPDQTTQGGRTGELRVFWAPFLILHLGGPSRITVLSVSDNELWLRYAIHLVTLSYTFGRIFLHNYFLNNDLWLASLLVFLAGAYKYIERVCCLFRARLTKFRDSTSPDPGPGVNYARLMLTYGLFRKSNIPAEFRVTTTTTAAQNDDAVCGKASKDSKMTHLQIVQQAFCLFKAFQGLFVNMAYSYSKREKSRRLFLSLDADQALAICGAELKLAYDVFYTKSMLLRNTVVWAILLNLLVFALELSSLVIWIRVDKSQFQPHSINVTHALVYGSIALDLFSLHALFTSDWVVAKVYTDANAGYCAAAFLQKMLFFLNPQRRLIYTHQSSIQQLNLFTAEPCFTNPFTLMDILRNSITPPESPMQELHKFLFHELQIRSNLAQKPRDVTEICKSRGMWALTLLSGKLGSNGTDLAKDFKPWISGVHYEESVVLWHIATTLCSEPGSPDHKLSETISNYMFYLLVKDTDMMPPSAKFLGLIIFRDTKAEAKRHLVRIPPPGSISEDEWVREACKSIMEVDTDLISPEEVRGQDSRSVLFEASVLAKKLQSLEKKGIDKWEVINKVWAEMLFYAAAHCHTSAHVEKLVEGSQLITTVWLLMAHLGLGKHFRHNKAKDRRAHLVITKLA